MRRVLLGLVGLAAIALFIALSLGPPSAPETAPLEPPEQTPAEAPPEPAPEARPVETRRIVVRCVNEEDGNPIEGVKVTVRGKTVVTDGAGEAAVEIPVEKTKRSWVKAEKKGRVRAYQEIRAEVDTVTVRLKRGATLCGRVLEEGTDRPLGDITVDVWSGADPVRTDGEGRFRLEGLGDRIGFTLHGPFHQRRRFVEKGLVAGETREVDYRVVPGGRIRGRVVDHEGNPVAGAWVDANWRDVVAAHIGDSWGAKATNVTDAEGRFDLGGVPPGEKVHVFAAVPKRATGVSGSIAVVAGREVEDLVVRLRPPNVVTFRVVTEEGPEPRRIQVSPLGGGSDPWCPVPGYSTSMPAPLSATGARLRTGGFVPGEFRLAVTAAGYVSAVFASEEVLPPEGEEEREIEVVLTRGLAISGWVRDAAGRPVPGATLWAYPVGRNASYEYPRGRATADDEGRFVLSGLDGCDHHLTVRNRNGAKILERKSVPAGTTDLVLTAEGVAGTIAGRVIDAEGKPVRHVSLVAFRVLADGRIGESGGSVWAHARDGEYRYQLAPGTWWILPPGGPAVRAEVGEGDSRGPVVVIAADRAVRGVVRGPEGTLADALVVVCPFPVSDDTPWSFREDVGFVRTAWTDRKGGFRVTGLGAGPITVRAYHPDFLPGRAEAEISKEEAVVTVTLPEGGHVDVRPVGPDTGGFQAVVIAEQRPGGQRGGTSPDGRFYHRAFLRKHPDFKFDLPSHEIRPGVSIPFGPYRPGTYRFTVQASFPVPGRSERVVLRKSENATVSGPGRTTLKIVFTAEEIASKLTE